MKKISIKFYILICIFFLSVSQVKADVPNSFNYGHYYEPTPDVRNNVCFNRKTGEYLKYQGNESKCDEKSDPYGYDSMKTISGTKQFVYCVEWTKDIDKKSKYVKASTNEWNPKSSHALILGIATTKLQEKYSTLTERYERTGATLNYYFQKNISGFSTSSYKFSSPASFITNIISQSTTEYNNNIKGKTGSSISTSSIKANISSSKIMDYINNGKYYLKKVDLSGLYKTYGNSSDTVTYTITLTPTNGTAVICSSTTKCTTSNKITVSGKDSYSFYVKLSGDDVNEDTTVKVRLDAKNESTYATTYLYYYENDKKVKQKLLLPDEIQVSRTNHIEYSLGIPSTTEHRITLEKVDEKGQTLSGSNFKMTKNGTNVTLKSDGKGLFTWNSGVIEEGKDDFSTAKFCITETTTPNGFLPYNKGEEWCLTNSVTGKDNVCLEITENDEAKQGDLEYCKTSDYHYVCVDAEGAITDEVTPENECKVAEPSPPLQPEPPEETTDPTPDVKEEESQPLEPEESEKTYEKKCYKIETNQPAAKEDYCAPTGNYLYLTRDGGQIFTSIINTKNQVKISKRSTTNTNKNEEENISDIPGAQLKICTEANYNSSKNDCEAAKNFDGDTMEWITTTSPRTWHGLLIGNYVIIETIYPTGYMEAKTNITKFSIDKDGVVKSEQLKTEINENKETEYTVIVNNEINKISISKQDATTSKELPGASLTICQTSSEKDENGDPKILMDLQTDDCLPASFADGTAATWISEDKPKEWNGLPAGTYYLVEKIAPEGYGESKPILFIMQENGIVTDKLGNPLTDNKIIMKDEKIVNVTTGILSFKWSVILIIISCITGYTSYYFIKRKKIK